MKTFRIILGPLAVIPIALLTDAIFLHPANYGENSLGELAFLVFGAPILILDLWAWSYPPIIEVYFSGMKDEAHSAAEYFATAETIGSAITFNLIG